VTLPCQSRDLDGLVIKERSYIFRTKFKLSMERETSAA
jgi:hypothetical protein